MRWVGKESNEKKVRYAALQQQAGQGTLCQNNKETKGKRSKGLKKKKKDQTEKQQKNKKAKKKTTKTTKV